MVEEEEAEKSTRWQQRKFINLSLCQHNLIYCLVYESDSHEVRVSNDWMSQTLLTQLIKFQLADVDDMMINLAM